MLNQERYSLENVVSRLANSLVERVNDGLILYQNLCGRLQVCQSQGDEIVFLDAC